MTTYSYKSYGYFIIYTYICFLACKVVHEVMEAHISSEGTLSSPFELNTSVKQSCALDTNLLGTYFSAVLHRAFHYDNKNVNTGGVFLRICTDGRLFNLARLRAKTKTQHIAVHERLFSDDASFVSHIETDLQSLMDCFFDTSKAFYLVISSKKAVVMHQTTCIDTPSADIIVDGTGLENVDNFCY